MRPSSALAVILGTFLLLLSVDLAREDQVVALFAEGGAIEAMTVLLLAGAAATAPVAALRTGQLGRHWQVPVILLLMALRELDLDKRLTSEGVLQLRLYSGPAPLDEKLFGLGVVALILWCGWRLMAFSVPDWWAALARRCRTAWLALGGVCAMLVGKTLDGIDRKLEPLGLRPGPELLSVLGRTEEMIEMAAAIFFAIAAVCHDRPRRQSRTTAAAASSLPAPDRHTGNA